MFRHAPQELRRETGVICGSTTRAALCGKLLRKRIDIDGRQQ